MSSAIEIYKEAYDLDFNKGDIYFAEALYKELIERYPHSEEREYAEIHLERIAKLKGNPDDPAIRPQQRTGNGGGGLAVVSFVLILLLAVSVGFAFYFSYRHYLHLASYEEIIHGLLSEKIGDSIGAEQSYERAQRMCPRNGIAYRCMAELYIGNGKTRKAELVARQWELIKPAAPALFLLKQRLKGFTRVEKQP